MSAEINHRSTAPSDVIFFTIFRHLERQSNRRKGTEYGYSIIKITKLAINEIINLSIKEIMIKYTISVKLSTVNISIFQLSDNLDKPDLL
ncbi:hypothetical protein RhiirC2_799384 [Rhizophagus irregularis]|uniref:Uncharacterized protein n=1 Tax=Rhizophagus irregularis TaxID=588596 RepID=A0A2N1M523_9GLOM|nr:hypothetical protein RhiirC2_799384 [Rhizophagus irregularis]